MWKIFSCFFTPQEYQMSQKAWYHSLFSEKNVMFTVSNFFTILAVFLNVLNASLTEADRETAAQYSVILDEAYFERNVFFCSLISIMFDYFANIPDFHSLMKHRSQLHPEQLSAESGFQCVKRSLKPFVSVPTLLGNFGGVWLASIGFASSSRITKMWAPALGVMISAWFSSLTSNKLSEELNQMNILESAAKAAACAAEHAPGQAIFLALAALCSTSKDLKKLRFYHHRNVNISILAEYIKTEKKGSIEAELACILERCWREERDDLTTSRVVKTIQNFVPEASCIESFKGS